MSIEQKVGQLFMLAFPGKSPVLAQEMIHSHNIGGCYISQENAETFKEAKKLCEDLQDTAHSTAHLPLILGVDQEGAWGVLVPDSTTGPGNLALGVSGDTQDTCEMYRIFAQEMGSAGYQTILGPCADVNIEPRNPIIGMRSFGEDPVRVAKHVRAAVNALREGGVISTAKHFPGHGDTHSDTHCDIPVVDKPLEVLETTEFVPFQAAIDSGVDIVMTSHILYPGIDSNYPATLSSAILTDLLRNTMGFTGVVLTDSMNMGAMRNHYSPADAAVRALQAGADIVMLSEEHYDHSAGYKERQIECIVAVLQAIKTGKLSTELLDEKLHRIIALKLKIQKNAKHHTNTDATTLPNPKENDIAYRAIRVFPKDTQAHTLQKENAIAIVQTTSHRAYDTIMNARGIGPNQAVSAFDVFAREFCSEWNYKKPTVVLYKDIAHTEFSAFDKILAITEDYPLPGEVFSKDAQIKSVKQLIQDHSDTVIVLGFRSPYDYHHEFPHAPCYVCTYSSRPCAAIAAARFFIRTVIAE